MWGGGSIRRDITERFYGACAGVPCLTENPGRKFFLADVQDVELKQEQPGYPLKVFTNGESLYTIDQNNSGTMWIKPDNENKKLSIYASVNKVTLMDLHERYRHISFDTLKTLPEGQKYHGKSTPKCESCIAGKSTKPAAKPIKQPRSDRILERIHLYLIGPLKPWLGKTYILTMMDDHSQYYTVIPIRGKTEASEKAQEWILTLQASTGKRVANIQADWGTEFTKLRTWGRKNGI